MSEPICAEQEAKIQILAEIEYFSIYKCGSTFISKPSRVLIIEMTLFQKWWLNLKNQHQFINWEVPYQRHSHAGSNMFQPCQILVMILFKISSSWFLTKLENLIRLYVPMIQNTLFWRLMRQNTPLFPTVVTFTVSSAEMLNTAVSLLRSSLTSLDGGRNASPVTKIVWTSLTWVIGCQKKRDTFFFVLSIVSIIVFLPLGGGVEWLKWHTNNW